MCNKAYSATVVIYRKSSIHILVCRCTCIVYMDKRWVLPIEGHAINVCSLTNIIQQQNFDMLKIVMPSICSKPFFSKGQVYDESGVWQTLNVNIHHMQKAPYTGRAANFMPDHTPDVELGSHTKDRPFVHLAITCTIFKVALGVSPQFFSHLNPSTKS